MCCLASCAAERYVWCHGCNFPSLRMTQGLDVVNEPPLSPGSDALLQGPFQKGVAPRLFFGAREEGGVAGGSETGK